MNETERQAAAETGDQGQDPAQQPLQEQPPVDHGQQSPPAEDTPQAAPAGDAPLPSTEEDGA